MLNQSIIPLGFMAPIIIRFKMFFQELCEAKVNWDETLSGPILIKWQSLVQDLQTSQSISIPRCYFDGIHDDVELYKLYGFCDASTGAYAAVIYLLMKTRTDHVVKFIASKTRVAPSRSQTIPRLELLSAFPDNTNNIPLGGFEIFRLADDVFKVEHQSIRTDIPSHTKYLLFS